MFELYTTFVYQPFLNLLVGIYYVLQQIPNLPHADMGIAVIIFTLALRFILLPITLASQRSEAERRLLEAKVKQLKHDLRSDPIRLNQEIKKLFRTNPRMVISATLDLTIQVVIALMLGGGVFGFVGLILAVPAAVLLQEVAADWATSKSKRRGHGLGL